MHQASRVISFAIILGACFSGPNASAKTITVAVASNFASTLKKLSQEFEQTSIHRIVISQGSSGKLATQILNGAPFDVFFSADALLATRVARNLNKNDRTHAYAFGRLAFVSNSKIDPSGIAGSIETSKYIAIGNPLHSPYGVAAAEFLNRITPKDRIKHKLVLGENIGQALRFVLSGNADVGFVSLAHAKLLPDHLAQQWLAIPANSHGKMEQHYVVIKSNVGVAAFLKFIGTRPAKAVIESSGYSVP